MRRWAFILSAIACAGFPAQGVAASAPPLSPPPPLRYSVEIPPGTGDTPPAPPAQHTASVEPAANPPLRYSVQDSGWRAAPQPAPQSAPVPQVKSRPLAPRRQSNAKSNPVRRTKTVTVHGYRGYALGPGDKVHITVYGENDLTGDFEISGSGRIAFPLIGDVKAAGMTAPELGRKLESKLANGYLKSPRVAVAITTYRPFYIIGQVNKPGRYPYSDGMTAMNAIALAGGFTPSAAESYVYVRHQGQTKEARLPADDTTEIEPGDVVRIGESGFWSVMSVLRPITGLVGAARYGVP